MNKLLTLGLGIVTIVSLYACKETRTEVSNKVFYDPAVVINKHYEEADDSTAVAIAAKSGDLTAINHDNRYVISFKGIQSFFNLDDEEIFNQFKIGDSVNVGYKKEFKVTYNKHKNFEEEISRVILGYEFVSVEKKH
ncbi:MAG: hypothetical protein ABIB43_04640 [archaeon]